MRVNGCRDRTAARVAGLLTCAPVNSFASSPQESSSRAVGSAVAQTAAISGMGKLTSSPAAASSAVIRSSPTTELGSNAMPKTRSANSRIRRPVASVEPPSVAEVATGVTPPSGGPPAGTRSVAPSRRSSIATSVPCAPS